MVTVALVCWLKWSNMQYHPGNPRIKATLQRTMSKTEPKAQAPDDVPAPGASEKPKLGATRKPTRNPTRKPTPSPTTKKPTKAATKKPWKGWTANRGFLENARKVLTTSRARKPDAIAAAIVSLGEAIEHAGGGLTGPTSRFKVKANETRMHVVTTTFNSKSPARAREYAEVMGWLLHNRHVSVVHAFSQEAEGQDETLKHFIGKSEYADRLHVIRVGQPAARITYKHLFMGVNIFVPFGEIGIIQNSDIYYDETLQNVPYMLDSLRYRMETLIISLSRRATRLSWKSPAAIGGGEGKCPAPQDSTDPDHCKVFTMSHDAFMLRSPFGPVDGKDWAATNNFIQAVDHPQNVMGGENVVVWETKKHGYSVLNPCFHVCAYHHHCSQVRTYNATQRADTGSVGCNIWSEGGKDTHWARAPNGVPGQLGDSACQENSSRRGTSNPEDVKSTRFRGLPKEMQDHGSEFAMKRSFMCNIL